MTANFRFLNSLNNSVTTQLDSIKLFKMSKVALNNAYSEAYGYKIYLGLMENMFRWIET